MQLVDVDAVVAVHERAFAGFFLALLGPAFLRELYSGLLQDPSGIAYVCEEQSRVCGFVAGTGQPSDLYRRLLRKRWWRFGFASSGAIMRQPSIVPRLVRAFTMPQQAEAYDQSGLLMAIAVAPDCQGRRIGGSLLDAFLASARDRGIMSVYLTTDRDNNDRVNTFYAHKGFRIARSYVTHEGRWMNEYVIDLSA
jgi:ribosomal protein S18 acetylase RimI-like enzyme